MELNYKDYDNLRDQITSLEPEGKPIIITKKKLLEIMEVCHDLGFDDGESMGFREAHNCDRPDEDEEINEAWDNGRQEGYDDGYDRGRQEGYDEGYSDGESSGREEGYEDGRQVGFDEGYNSCMEDHNLEEE